MNQYLFVNCASINPPNSVGSGFLGKVEQNEHCVAVLRSRMFEKMIADGPVAEDVTTYIPSPSIKKRARGICAGFPCQAL